MGSIIIGFLPAYIIANSDIGFGSPWLIWGFLSIVAAIFLRKVIDVEGTPEINVEWESPEKIRSDVINSPQFVGRFDRDRGLLDSTARMVQLDVSEFQTMWMGRPKSLRISKFRGELLGQDGSPLEYISVEIKGDVTEWVGTIVDGDRVRVKGKVEKDGILHAKSAFNYSTNSWVGEKK